MPVIIIYLIKTTIISGLFYFYYRAVLCNRYFHQWNRFYLLGAVIISLLLPLIHIELPAIPGVSEQPVVKLLGIVPTAIDPTHEKAIMRIDDVPLQEMATAGYVIISAFVLYMLLHGMLKLFRLYRKCPRLDINGVHIILTQDKHAPFCFFRNIFWKTDISLHSPEGKRILEHEMVHVREVHSADRLFMNIVLVFSWLNPFYWIIRKEVAVVHEFIADGKTFGHQETGEFSQMVLAAAYPGYEFGMVSKFSSSSLKRRLIMLTTIKKTTFNYLSRILIIPLSLIIFTAFTIRLKQSENKNLTEPITVIIDAGHGGQDAGAVANDGTIEKNINLSIAKKILELNTNKNIRILLTRKNDIAKELKERTDLAIKEKTTLFISLHVDNDQSSPAGISFYITNKNSAYAKQSQLLGSYMSKELGNIYTTSTELRKRTDKGIWILDAPAINYPALLIECGNLAHAADLEFIKSDPNQQRVAEGILKAIAAYSTGN